MSDADLVIVLRGQSQLLNPERYKPLDFKMTDPEKASRWQVFFTSASNRQVKKLPSSVKEALARLIGDLEQGGPVQRKWSHFGLLKKGKGIPESAYHCHIKSGRPTYVVCWMVQDKKIQIIEVYYVGTHENAPY